MTLHATTESRKVIGVDGKEYTQTIVDSDNAAEMSSNFAFPMQLVRFKPDTKINLFVDMDGTLAHWRSPGEAYRDINGDLRYFHQDDIYEAGYFKVLPPEENVVRAIEALATASPFTVYVLSAIEPRSATAYIDKNFWLDQQFGAGKNSLVPTERRVFMPCGTKKVDYLNLINGDLNILLDDYTRNLQEFTIGRVNNVGIKILNGINDTHQTWQGHRVDGKINPMELAKLIVDIYLKEMNRRSGQCI